METTLFTSEDNVEMLYLIFIRSVILGVNFGDRKAA